jgi:hypothetical protein
MEREIMRELTLKQVKALACQNKLKGWPTMSRATMVRELEKLDTIKGLETDERCTESEMA